MKHSQVMTRRRLAWIGIAVLAALGIAGAAWSTFGNSKIVLTTAQLQERANRQLPREFKGVTVERATVAIADGRIALRVEVQATALGQGFAAVASARGVPIYDGERGEFFFDADDVKVESIAPTRGGLAQRLDRLDQRLGGRIEAAAAKAIAAGIKAYLASRPIYRFKDDLKGIVLKAAIGGIAIEADTLAVTVSLINLTAMAGICLAAVLLALFLVFRLVRNPGWGLSVLGAAVGPDPS
jgi:hypothetical protein